MIRKGKTLEAEESLLKAAESSSPMDRHYAYVKLIRLYQKMIQSGEDRLDQLMQICKQDIELFPDFHEAWTIEYLHQVPTPYFPSFSVLAEIYEEQGKIREAIDLCELALGYGLEETIGEDFPVRLERLYAKSEPEKK
ncbi:hypothetical protein [Dethiobacter alkaliphilus]|uniref:hypothetical protein n=1 Tax=Dethiobacter alkaliphilus TaxID=427926 RepID=UPI002227877D|nr:hypothetical protein [Dethiobacter alkaliphilus]MCW3490920.1 hypothetical protein [Dethiobacter alkaliphilus]